MQPLRRRDCAFVSKPLFTLGNVEDEISILGALFQAGLFIMLSAMQSANALVSDRVIFYKQMDAKFFSSWPFVIGKALAGFPQVTCLCLLRFISFRLSRCV